MKKYILSLLAVASATTILTSCNDNLDTDPRVTEMTAATFPGKPADVEALNAATYSILNTLGGGDQSQILNNPFYWWSLMSDDNYGSGGLQDFVAKSLHHFTMADANQYEYDWNLLYGGIARANNTIETIDNVPWTDDEKAQRNQLLGEAFFMRGLYTMWLTQLYGDIPVITSTLITADSYQERSAEEIVFPQIIADFVSAKTLMKAERANGSGHADKYCAEAFLARAYMFWAGFYKGAGELKNGAPAIELKGLNDEEISQEGLNVSSVSKEDVVNGLKDIISNGGYKLCEDFRSLWNYSNSFLWKEAQEENGYAFIKDMKEENCFDKPGMGNGNTEELFQIQFMNASSWNIGGYYNSQRMYSNYLSCFWGLRNGASNQNGQRDKTYPFNQGWGQGTPSCNIWDDWTAAENNPSNPYTDARKKASLIDLNNEIKEYTYEKDDCEESGYSVKKYASVNLWANDANNSTWWAQCEGYKSPGSLGNAQQGDHFEDFYLMRYSDVLLMMTELTGDASYMNQVQRRAGVPETPYSLKAVMDERRWEFAFEGLRFNDLRRWTGKGCSNGTYAPDALQAQQGKQIVCLGQKDKKISMQHMTCSWTERYKATDGFLPKPQNQISLHNGGLTQNPGWETSDPKTQYKALY